MDKIIQFVQSLPKGLQILLGASLVMIIGYLGFKSVYGEKKVAASEISENVVIDFPDPNEVKGDMNKLDEMARADYGMSANEYWSSLGPQDTSTNGGLLSQISEEGQRNDGNYHKGEYLDPSVYSELEIYAIKNGLESKQSIDGKHARMKELEAKTQAEIERDAREHSDSAYLARTEKAFAMAQKYIGTGKEEEEPKKPAEPEPKKITITQSNISTTTLSEDGIICSLENPNPVAGTHSHGGEFVVSPAKATFLKNETLSNGQRVIMRLMQDLMLSNGVVIPANTHINGICEIKNRLKITVKAINYGGKIYYANIDIYDNDGTEGIYCPVIANEQVKKAGKNMAKNIGRTVSDLAGAALGTINGYAGKVVLNSANEITSLIDSNGNITVNVSSGYEFYMFENITKKNE